MLIKWDNDLTAGERCAYCGHPATKHGRRRCRGLDFPGADHQCYCRELILVDYSSQN